jgi:hypothetical protein
MHWLENSRDKLASRHAIWQGCDDMPHRFNAP